MTEYEFVYTLWGGINWQKVLRNLGDKLIEDTYDEFKIYVYPYLRAALEKPEYDVSEMLENSWRLAKVLLTKRDKHLKRDSSSKYISNS